MVGTTGESLPRREEHPDHRPTRNPGDGWVDCRCGAQHWGLLGAAGLLVTDGAPESPAVVLQHRALWSHQGGTWGIPGGALAPGESAPQGALREAAEEAGVPADGVRVWASSVLHHPDWTYTTVLAEAARPFTPTATDAESLELAWVGVDDVPSRSLLPAFGAAWPNLRRLLGRRVLLVADGANVVGARPDGWWRDRPAAAERLHAKLVASLEPGLPARLLGLPGDRWWPDILLVLEGDARGADLAADDAMTPGPAATVSVARAPGSGDDAVVARVSAALGEHGYSDVVVVTSDRGLRERVRAAGADVSSPGPLLDALDASRA